MYHNFIVTLGIGASKAIEEKISHNDSREYKSESPLYDLGEKWDDKSVP